MTPLSDDALLALLNTVESDRVERKRAWAGDAPEKVRQAVCAFANDLPGHALPGVVFIGAADDGSPHAIAVDEQLLKTLADIKTDAFMDGYAGTEVVAEFCEFLPFAGVVVNNKSFKVENHDADPDDPKSLQGVLHNPHSFVVKGTSSATGFNIGLAKKGDKLDKPVVFRGGAEKDGFYRLQCDQHEFMQGYFLPVSSPHFAVVKDDGSFEIKDVPAGKHKVVAWHPFAAKGKKVEFEVDVADGGTANLKAEIK